MELLKQSKKDIVSKANVAMPASFVKPLDYSIDLLVRTHPTLRQYQGQMPCTEVDPEYHLYPSKRERVMPKDEIELKMSRRKRIRHSWLVCPKPFLAHSLTIMTFQRRSYRATSV